MSLRTKSRMPASTSDTAARLLSSSVDSIFSERIAVIGCSPVSRLQRARMSPARRKLKQGHQGCRFWPHRGQYAAMLDRSREALQARRAHQPVSYTHLRAHETRHDIVCRLLLEKKKN